MWWAVVVAAMAVSEARSTTTSGPTPVVAAPAPRVIRPESYAQERACVSQAPTVVWSSRVGHGKSFGGCLNEVLACTYVPGVPCALTRLERASMDTTTLAALQKLLGEEAWMAGWRPSQSTYFFPKVRCPDGKVRQSKIHVFGWKDPGRHLGAEFARIVIDQAEEIERDHVSIAQTRLRFMDPWVEEQLAKLGLAPRQMVLICNPDDPDHWINRDYEVEDKGMREELNPRTGNRAYEVILSQPGDNAAHLPPDYQERLDELAGTVWYERLVLGRWARAQGLVYGAVWNPAVHIVSRPQAWERWGWYPPPSWRRFRSFDFGVNNPFTVAWYAESPDGLIYTYREGYATGRPGSEWADWVNEQEQRELAAWRAALLDAEEARVLEPYLGGFVCQESWSDHDLEWRRELSKKGVWTQPAIKDIKSGVRTLTSWLKRRRIVYVRDMLVEQDATLAVRKLPTTVIQEYGRYHWPKPRGDGSESSQERLDVPVDKDNHGLDRDRYFAASHDNVQRMEVW